jgi:hypothetical protein
MNDNELVAAVRQSLTGIHSATPLEQIVTRSRRLRARRRIPGIAVALAVTAGAAMAVIGLLPPSHHPGSPPGTQLAAWTVIKQTDGTISVTIRELSDPAGLQRTLRADGIPANVTFFGQMPRACQRYPVGIAQINRIFTGRQVDGFPVMVIHPAALPPGAGVAINPPASQPIVRVAFGLVHASPQCTGS